MQYFPQLQTGAMVHYPLLKRCVRRTIVSETPDGRLQKLTDPGGTSVSWEVTFGTLSNEERTVLEEFFRGVEGRLGEFAFLDPTDNLLVRSEELTATAWVKGPLIELVSGIADPAGTTRATRLTNSGAAEQAIQQTVEGPGWFQYCFSFYIRSEQAERVTFSRTSGSSVETKVWTSGPNWSRASLSGRCETTAESVTFGLGLEQGSSVDVFGMQAEAQPAPSPYRKTTSQGGVYLGTRFDQDELIVVSDGPEQHSCTLRIMTA